VGILKNAIVKFYSRIQNVLNNEKGAQTLEWVALGAVVVTIAFFLSTAFGDNGGAIKEIVTAITDKIKTGINGG
jgi:hypothetical protein